MSDDEHTGSDASSTPLHSAHPAGPLAKMLQDPEEAVERVDVASSGMIAPKFEQLQEMTDAELREAHDRMTSNTVVGTGFLRDELRRRDAVRADATSGRIAESALKVARSNRVIAVVALVVALAGLGLGAFRDTSITVPAPEVTVLPAPVVVQPAPPAR